MWWSSIQAISARAKRAPAPFRTMKRPPESLVPRSKSMMSSASPISQCGLGWKSNETGSPDCRTTTFPLSSGPSGTSSAGMFGISSSSSRSRVSSSRTLASRACRRSPRNEDRATRSVRRCSACFASFVPAVFASRDSSPISLEIVFRSARSDSTSASTRRHSASTASASSSGASVWRRASARRTSSGCSRSSWILSMRYAFVSCAPRLRTYFFDLPRHFDGNQRQLADVIRHAGRDAAARDVERLGAFQLVLAYPAESLICGDCALAPADRAAEIDHVDVLVWLRRTRNVFDENRVGSRNLLGVRERGGGLDRNHLGEETRLLRYLAEDCLRGVLVRLDMSARRHPLLQPLVPVKEGAGPIDHERSGREVPHHPGSPESSSATRLRITESSLSTSGVTSLSKPARSSGQRSIASKTASSSSSVSRPRRSARVSGYERPSNSSRAFRARTASLAW